MERVDLRAIWTSESGDFTPWLAKEENLRLLGEAIGMELECEAQEKDVGPFRADILCKETNSDHWVLIENQLERTDHTHLGQLLTYAAGLKAVTIVWIANTFTEEHRAALDWLNEITDERFSFFGLEIELWRIENSPVAPKLNIVCKPNDWSKQATQAAEGELSETSQLYREYWQAFKEYLEETKSPIGMRKPLVDRHTLTFGYRCFSLMRASAVVNCQSTPTCRRFRSWPQAWASAPTVDGSGIRRSRHCRVSTLNSDSATFNQLPCLGVCTSSSFLANRKASAGS
jgi:hypothetical protein